MMQLSLLDLLEAAELLTNSEQLIEPEPLAAPVKFKNEREMALHYRQQYSPVDEVQDLKWKIHEAKALAEKNQQLQSEKAVIESELVDLETRLEQIFSGGYNEFSDIEAAKIQREIEVRQRCKREIMAHFESPESIVPAWAKWQDRVSWLIANHPASQAEADKGPVLTEACQDMADIEDGKPVLFDEGRHRRHVCREEKRNEPVV